MELDIVNLISNVGFPIVAFLLMYRLVNNMLGSLKENTEAIRDLRELIELKLLK